jgi:branched-chain amino acid transport system ATP-binding protein
VTGKSVADVRLELAAVEAAYGDVRVLAGVTLSVAAGEIVALLGPNGAGKSTLLKTVAGLLRPRAGALTWNGEDLTRVAPHRIVERGIALVPEGRRLFGGMTVGENLDLGAFVPRARAGRQASLERVLACSRCSPSAAGRAWPRCPAASSRWSPSVARS